MKILYIGRWLKGFRSFVHLGQKYNLSADAQYRLKVISYYFHRANKNACLTARKFDLHRNTIGNWLKLYDPSNLHKLEPKASIPIKTLRKKTSVDIIQKIII